MTFGYPTMRPHTSSAWTRRLKNGSSRALAFGDLRIPPGNRLEKLTGDRASQHGIRINQRWRICFVWRDGDAYEVEIVDYH